MRGRLDFTRDIGTMLQFFRHGFPGRATCTPAHCHPSLTTWARVKHFLATPFRRRLWFQRSAISLYRKRVCDVDQKLVFSQSGGDVRSHHPSLRSVLPPLLVRTPRSLRGGRLPTQSVGFLLPTTE